MTETKNIYRQLWLDSGLSQEEMARRLGVSKWSVYRWCAGKFRPSHLHRAKITDKMQRLASDGRERAI